MGQLVELGGSFAVNQMLGHRISGLLAQLLWRGVYLYKLGDARDRLGVTADWVANLVMPRRVTRLPSHS
jgi:NADH dehydrogenase FAD-containing subunit